VEAKWIKRRKSSDVLSMGASYGDLAQLDGAAAASCGKADNRSEIHKADD